MHIKTNPLLEKKQGYNLTFLESGIAKCDLSWKNVETQIPYTRIYYNTAGNGAVIINNKKIILKSNRFYLLPSGISFNYYTENFLEQIYFHIIFSDKNSFDLLRGINKILEMDIEPYKLKKIEKLYLTNKKEDIIILKMQVIEDILKVLKINKIPFQREKYSKIVNDAVHFIDKNLSMKLKIKEIAKSLFVSQNTLSAKFKQEIKMPLGKYIDNRCLYQARELLLNRELSVLDVSEKLGFYDQFYFSRRFKALFHVTPTAYKKNNL